MGVFEEDCETQQIGLIGAIQININNLPKKLAEYQQLIDKEDDEEKKLKHQLKSESFDKEYFELKETFSSLIKRRESVLNDKSRQTLFQPADDNPYNAELTNRHPTSLKQQGQAQMSMEDGLYKERNALSKGNEQLDHILLMASTAMDDLVEQNRFLIGAQQKLTDSLDTLGVSRATINKVNKIAFQDKWIFYGGAVLTFFIFWLILRYL